MAVFFDHKLQGFPTSASNVQVSCHRTYSLIAVASGGEGQLGDRQKFGSVRLYLDEGEIVDEATLQRSSDPSILAWHPEHKFLAVAWSSGELTVWNEHEHELSETSSVHRGNVRCLQWASGGRRLVSGDQMGTCAVWSMDAQSRLFSVPQQQFTLRGALTHCVIHCGPEGVAERSKLDDDLKELMRRADQGDEAAIDLFLLHRFTGTSLSRAAHKQPAGKELKRGANASGAVSLAFFIGGALGTVWYISAGAEPREVVSLGSAVHAMLFYAEKDILVTLSERLLLGQFNVSPEGTVKNLSEVKLGSAQLPNDVIWTKPGLLAMATGEGRVRLWDVNNDESYLLEGSEDAATDQVTCLTYNYQQELLVAGTASGTVVMWKKKDKVATDEQLPSSDGSMGWECTNVCMTEVRELSQIKCTGGQNVLAVSNGQQASILNRSRMSAHYNQEVSAVQLAPSQLAIEYFNPYSRHHLKSDIHIRGVYVTREETVVWNGKQVVVYDMSPEKGLLRAAGAFSCETSMIVVHHQSIVTVEAGTVNRRTFQGSLKQVLSLAVDEGEPILMSLNGCYLVVATTNGCIILWDLSHREARLLHRRKVSSNTEVGLLGNVQCNSTGSHVSYIFKRAHSSVLEARLHVWDVESDRIHLLDLTTMETGNVDDETLGVVTTNEELCQLLAGRCPLTVYWDDHEAKVLICEAAKVFSVVKESDSVSSGEHQVNVAVAMLFFTPEHGLLLHDSFLVEKKLTCMMGISIPYMFFAQAPVPGTRPMEESFQLTDAPGKSEFVTARVPLRDFADLDEVTQNSEDTRKALVNFSYHLTVGNLDEAFQAIKLVKSERVWENLARMCVKRRRIDVAAVCLGNMGDAAGARALRLARSEKDVSAQLAVMALQLDMKDEAEELLKGCGRYDLLNKFYQSTNNWRKALQVAEEHDRVHLRNTFYAFAKHLEGIGDLPKAISCYEKSETHRSEVPRMLLDLPNELEAYVMKNNDKALCKWWASYLESAGEMETAVQFYQKCQAHQAHVRVLCFCGKLQEASAVAMESGDKSACFHLARQFETMDVPMEAIKFYSKAMCFTNAIRLAKEHHLDSDLMSLALQSTKEDMVDVARYFETSLMHDKAVLLYHKGGAVGKALDLSFRTKQFGALQSMAGDLDENTDPELLVKCAEFFQEHEHFEKAIDMLVIARKYLEALDVCMQHHIIINEELAERMTLEKQDVPSENEFRIRVLERLAECCEAQGSYHLATKKFTQAGTRTKAMKALLKSGDMEKITFFTNVSRQRDLYVMAANWMQQQDWRKDANIMKQIITFYNKAKALDSLAGFYDSCAQVEIDEYQNYEKALTALNEAFKCLTKAKLKNMSAQESQAAFIKQRVAIIQKFVDAKKTYEADATEGINLCQLLLEEPDLETAVRAGDVYGFMIEHFAREKNYKQAFTLMQEMRQRIPNVNMAFYVNMATIEGVHRSLGIPLGRGMGGDDTVDGEDLADDIDDEADLELQIDN